MSTYASILVRSPNLINLKFVFICKFRHESSVILRGKYILRNQRLNLWISGQGIIDTSTCMRGGLKNSPRIYL